MLFRSRASCLGPGFIRVCSSVGQSTRLISVGSMVQIHPDPPESRGCSSAGRAPALQAGGHRFDPVHLHQLATKWMAQARNCDGSWPVRFLQWIACRSLTIQRVEISNVLMDGAQAQVDRHSSMIASNTQTSTNASSKKFGITRKYSKSTQVDFQSLTTPSAEGVKVIGSSD